MTSPAETATADNGTPPHASKPHIGHIPQSDSGICLTPQGQGDALSPQLEKEASVIAACSSQFKKETDVDTTGEEKSDVQYPQESEDVIARTTSQGHNKASLHEDQKDDGQNKASLHEDQKDDGTGLFHGKSCASLPVKGKNDEGSSTAQAESEQWSFTVDKEPAVSISDRQNQSDLHPASHGLSSQKEDETQVKDNHEEVPFMPRLVTEGPSSSSPSLNSSSSSLRQGSNSPTKHLRVGSNASGDSRSLSSNPQDHPKLARSPRHGAMSPDDFAHQTKCLVLHFLHETTSEQHLLHLSQTSLSTTSESEPRFRSYAETLRRRWQENRSQSSPTSPHIQQWPKPLAKTKGSRSSPNLKDANFFKDVPEVKNTRARRLKGKFSRPTKSSRRSPKPPRQSPVQLLRRESLVRSVSQTTDNSEHGPDDSDADDELDSSFDSSHQGSTTSLSFRNRLAHYHQQRLPTVHSESESLGDSSLITADEGALSDTEVGKASPILSLDMINVEQRAVTPIAQYARVNQYLVQMNEESNASFQIGTDTADTTLDLDEVDSPPFHRLSHPDQAFINSGRLVPPDHTEEGAVSGGFEPDDTFYEQQEETEGACGGVEPGGQSGGRADRTKLKLDLTDANDAAVVIDAVHMLQEAIEEEMTSFDSEFEEAIHILQSDPSSHATGLSPSHSFNSETAEAARILARIGDEVQQRYFDHLDRAVGRFMLDNCAGLFTYENFRDAALMALDKDQNGWKQVALLLLYSQHVALQMAQTGRRGLHRIVDYTVQLLADTYADFIIRQGGWTGISSSQEHSSTPSSPDYTGPVHIPFSTHLNATITTMDDITQGSRSSSAPDLSGVLQSSTPNDTLDSSDLTITGNSPASLIGSAEGEATATGSEVGSPDSIIKESEGEQKGEEGEGVGGAVGNVVSTVGSAVFNSGLLARAAVSVGVLAVGAAFALSLSRG
ncbi:hypothetical protein V1264_016231 [Littorina saxatilis]|uniref:Bcl-2 Bcl-2 homology region 1-3 domain-containing protein n=2 Tax=Littorina saxatilis TaxID=31220 RepID=A0AAN9GHQ8_9CAEN